MIKIPSYSVKGEKKEAISLKTGEKKLGFNEDLVAQAVLVEKNHILNKFGKTKTKGEVRGGGKKPWKQKGTGRARAGSLRSPLFKGGGVTFGPTREKKFLSIPPRMRKLAFAQLIVKRADMGDIAVIEEIKLENNKTKEAAKVLMKICAGKKSLIICDTDEIGDLRPWNNLALSESVSSKSLLLSDLLKDQTFIFTKKGFNRVERMVSNE